MSDKKIKKDIIQVMDELPDRFFTLKDFSRVLEVNPNRMLFCLRKLSQEGMVCIVHPHGKHSTFYTSMISDIDKSE